MEELKSFIINLLHDKNISDEGIGVAFFDITDWTLTVYRSLSESQKKMNKIYDDLSLKYVGLKRMTKKQKLELDEAFSNYTEPFSSDTLLLQTEFSFYDIWEFRNEISSDGILMVSFT